MSQAECTNTGKSERGQRCLAGDSFRETGAYSLQDRCLGPRMRAGLIGLEQLIAGLENLLLASGLCWRMIETFKLLIPVYLKNCRMKLAAASTTERLHTVNGIKHTQNKT